MAKYRPLDCGPLAVATINGVLGLNLAPGRAHFSASAQEHAEDRHPADHAICIANIRDIVRAPEWVGRNPRDQDGFTLVRSALTGRAIILVAVKIRPDTEGRYIVASTYRLTRHDIETRLAKGFLLAV